MHYRKFQKKIKITAIIYYIVIIIIIITNSSNTNIQYNYKQSVIISCITFSSITSSPSLTKYLSNGKGRIGST